MQHPGRFGRGKATVEALSRNYASLSFISRAQRTMTTTETARDAAQRRRPDHGRQDLWRQHQPLDFWSPAE